MTKIPARNLPFEEKLNVLEKIHSRSHQEAKDQISKWKDELARLKIEENWLQHPNTILIKATLTDQYNRIVSILAGDESLSESDRKVYFKTKNDVILPLLAVFMMDPESEMRALENQVDDNL